MGAATPARMAQANFLRKNSKPTLFENVNMTYLKSVTVKLITKAATRRCKDVSEKPSAKNEPFL